MATFGYFASLPTQHKFGSKKSMLIYFCLAFISGLFLFYDGTNMVFAITLLTCRFSLSTIFSLIYIAQNELFSGPFLCFSLSIVNFTSKIATLAAPFAAEASSESAISLLLILCVLGLFLTACLKFKKVFNWSWDNMN